MRRMTMSVALAIALVLGAAAAQDAGMAGHEVEVTVTNTTAGQTFAAPVVLSHDGSYLPLQVGHAALPELVPLAEDGDPADLATVAAMLPAIAGYAVAPGPLAPGASVTLRVPVDAAHPLVSVLAMLVSTNDAILSFGTDLSAALAGDGPGAMGRGAMGGDAMVGEAMAGDAMAGEPMSGDAMGGEPMSGDAMGGEAMSGDAMAGEPMAGDAMAGEGMGGEATAAPAMRSSAMAPSDGIDLYDGTVRVLDAGSEADTEACADVPGPPCGSAHARHPAMAEGAVSLHAGLRGDGDLDPAVYGWTDPVATVSVAVR